MFKEDITKSFYFGAKVKIMKNENYPAVHYDREYCLIGFNEYKYVLVEWDKRGELPTDSFFGSIYTDLELVN